MTTTAPRPAAEQAPPALTHQQILLVLSGLLLGMFLAALEQTIVSPAMRTIAGELNGQISQAWVTTACLITSTISTPLYGKLSDQYGRKPFYLVEEKPLRAPGGLAAAHADAEASGEAAKTETAVL